MAISIRLTNNTFISADAAGQCPLAGKSAADPAQRIDVFENYTAGRIFIAASGTETLQLGDVAVVRGIELIGDRGYNLTFNGGTDVLQVRPAVAPTATNNQVTTKARFLVETDGITSVSIVNIDTTTRLTLDYKVWGDLAP